MASLSQMIDLGRTNALIHTYLRGFPALGKPLNGSPPPKKKMLLNVEINRLQAVEEQVDFLVQVLKRKREIIEKTFNSEDFRMGAHLDL